MIGFSAVSVPVAASGVPLNHIVSVVSAGAGSVWFVLPDFTAGEPGSMHTSAAKCGGHVAALATDVYSATYLFGALTVPQQNEVLDTNSAYVSQSEEFMRETNHSLHLSLSWRFLGRWLVRWWVTMNLFRRRVHSTSTTTVPLRVALRRGILARLLFVLRQPRRTMSS